MSEHMKETMKKARSRVNLLRRIRPLIDANRASLIFKVMILPILTYCPYSTFVNIPNYVENKVQNIEDHAQKIIGKILPYSMKNFQKRRIATYVHQCLTNNVCKNCENYFEVIESKIKTRNNGTLVRLPKVKLEVTHQSFFFQGGYEYNTSPRAIRSEKNHKNSKAKISKFHNQQNYWSWVFFVLFLASAHSVWTITMCSASNSSLFLNFSVQSGLYIAFSLV